MTHILLVKLVVELKPREMRFHVNMDGACIINHVCIDLEYFLCDLR
jgi:hypothetical protein